MLQLAAETLQPYDGSMTPRRSVLFLYFLLGAYAVCAQATLLRETQVVLFGSELAWGLVLASWLAGVALGALTGGRLLSTSRGSLSALAVSNIAMPLVLSLEIILLRGSRSVLGAGPGEFLGPGSMLLVAAAATIPVSFWIGVAFPAASSLLGDRQKHSADKARSVGWVYLTEAAGSLVGGASFSFAFVSLLDPFSLVIGGAVILAAGTCYLIRELSESKKAATAVILWAVAATGVILTGGAAALERTSVELRWRSFASALELVASENSRYQNIAVGRLSNQFSLYTNGSVSSTWPDHSELAIEAHLAASQHPAPRRLLVLGGGVEGLLKELLRHNPERLDYVTLDARIVELVTPLLSEADREAIEDPRTHVHLVDARRFVKQATQFDAAGYDLVLVAAPEPASALLARLYTEEFFLELSNIMSDDAVLTLSLMGSAGGWSPEIAAYVGSVVTPLERVFPNVLLTFGDPVRVFAAKQDGVVSAEGDVLVDRYRSRGVTSPFFSPIWFAGASDMLDPQKRRLVRNSLRTQPPRLYNTDGRPVAAMYYLRLWLATSGSAHHGESEPGVRRARFPTLILDTRTSWVAAALIACAFAFLIVGLRTGGTAMRRTALFWSVGTTGFAAMGIEILLLYTFQVMYGFVYGMVGVVIGIFMFGLVVGSALMNRRLGTSSVKPPHIPKPMDSSEHPEFRVVLLLDVSLLTFSSVLIVALPILRASDPGPPAQLAVFALIAVAGVLAGMVFPLAASAWLRDQSSTARAAGTIDAADHMGGALGALVAGVALVPVLGVTGTCIVIAVMKLLSCLLVVAGIAASRGRLAVAVASSR